MSFDVDDMHNLEKYKIAEEKLKRYKEILNLHKLSDENYVEYLGQRLIILISSKCNTKCKHCYISYEGSRDPNELFEMINLLKDKYIIELNGAEILTNLGYLKSYKLLGQHFLISNGKAILDNPLTIEKLKENEITTVSLSYHFGIQDKISAVSFYYLNQIIDTLHRNDIEVRLMTTINSDNYNSILNMCDNALLLGARAIKFTNYISQGNALNLDDNNKLTNYQKKIFFEQLDIARQIYDKYDLLIERCGTFGKNSNLQKDHFQCVCIENSVVLTPDNNIYPCIFLAKPGYEIGKYVNGKILLLKDLHIDNDKCLSDEVCNKVYKIYK